MAGGRDVEELDELLVATRPDGIVAVQGPAPAVERFTRRVETVLGSPRLADALQAGSAVGAAVDAIPGVGEDGPRTFALTRRAVGLLRSNDVLPPVDGYVRGAIERGRDASSPLEWLPITAGTDLLQLQTAAVGLALRTAIRSLTEAVDRVERRVDELRDLVRAGQVGEVLGHHRVIAERLAMIDDPDGDGLGATDWAAVAHLHPHLVAALERTRFFVRSRMGATEPGRMVRSRVEVAERLVEANLPDALGLLATCEWDLVGWQRLRIDRVARTEPGHLDAVLVDVESTLALHRAEDQALVDELTALIDDLMEPTGLEGLEVFQRRRLLRHVEAIHAATATFARQRDLELADLEHGELPGLRDTVGLVARTSLDGGRRALGRVPRPRRRRRPELEPPRPPSQPPPPDPARRAPD